MKWRPRVRFGVFLGIVLAISAVIGTTGGWCARQKFHACVRRMKPGTSYDAACRGFQLHIKDKDMLYWPPMAYQSVSNGLWASERQYSTNGTCRIVEWHASGSLPRRCTARFDPDDILIGFTYSTFNGNDLLRENELRFEGTPSALVPD